MLTSMPTPLMIACHPEWRLQWRPYGCGLMVQCWMFSWFHRCIQWRCRVVRGRSQEKQNWVWYDMFANVHGWIVRPRFRTVCGTMRQNSVRHALKSHVAHGYCIGCAECGRWHVRAGVRYLGMGWCWQHPAMRYAARRWLRFPRRDIPDRDLPPSCPTPSFPFQAPADFKKMRRCHYTVFSFFTRVTQLAKNHSWSAKRNAGNGDLRMVRSCCGNLYENESILSYLYVHIGSNGVIETWVRWVLPFGLSKKCKH